MFRVTYAKKNGKVYTKYGTTFQECLEKVPAYFYYNIYEGTKWLDGGLRDVEAKKSKILSPRNDPGEKSENSFLFRNFD